MLLNHEWTFHDLAAPPHQSWYLSPSTSEASRIPAASEGSPPVDPTLHHGPLLHAFVGVWGSTMWIMWLMNTWGPTLIVLLGRSPRSHRD